MSEQLWAKDLPLDEQIHAFTVGDDPITDLQLLAFDAIGSAAHARMIGETGLIPESEARELVGTLHRMRDKAERGEMVIAPEQEDGHTAIEHALTEELGATGRRIHLGRSRNDQVQTVLRLCMRARLLDLGQTLARCASAFAQFAAEHCSARLPGYTHLRRAMPSSWGMWGVAFAEGLTEELEQLSALWTRLDRCPLGAAAGFGAAIVVNRERTADLLGFTRVQRSPLDVMNSRGRHEQAIAGWIISAANTIEKALWDLLIWSTDEFGFVRLPDAFTTGSSIMPQKRNPDVLELARARCRELRGLQSLLSHLAGGLPSSYHRDHQLLKTPFLGMITKGEQLFALVARLVPALEVDEKRSAAACSPEIYAAREASRLAAKGTPFRDAYGRIAQQLQDGSFRVDDAVEETADLHLKEVIAAIARNEAWIADRRQFLTATSDRLFDWK